MILYLSNQHQIRGDLIKSAVLRSDLAPIPVTLEAEIRTDDSMERLLNEGDIVTTGAGDAMRIVKSVQVTERAAQGDREVAYRRITAMLDACHSVTFVRSRAIIKEGSSLAAIYRASGARLQAIDADFPVPRFTCPIGDTPSFHIARALQEEGGVVRWSAGKLNFMRLGDLFKQKPVAVLPNNASDDVVSGFMERHDVPSFFSLNDVGAFTFGDLSKPRSVRYSPFKNTLRLRNMSQCLIQRKIIKVAYAGNLVAGNLINFTGGVPLVVITAAHVFENGEESNNQYTRLWLGALK